MILIFKYKRVYEIYYGKYMIYINVYIYIFLIIVFNIHSNKYHIYIYIYIYGDWRNIFV